MSSWEHVPTGATTIRQVGAGEVIEMTTANGNTYRIISASNPIWHSSDMRLAVHRLVTNDYLIQKVDRGVDLLFFRLGHNTFVKYARKYTPEWYDAVSLMQGISVQGY